MTQSGDAQWRPNADLVVLRKRAEILARVRAFFAQRDVLEVETPLLSSTATTDVHLASFAVPMARPGEVRYLHTSPEFAMKRLLAAGIGPIYQLAKVFRADEYGRLHNPEFTMLEWYRPGFDHHQLMDEVEALVNEVMTGDPRAKKSERITYREAFVRYARMDPLCADLPTLAAVAQTHGLDTSALTGADRDAWLDLLLTHVVEPHLGRHRPTFLYDYPASQAALARIRDEKPPVAERFELYLDGIELANGFHELTDATAQRERFETDLIRRRQRGLPMVPLDDRLLAALQAGLPACAGVALGLDRLIMLCARKSRLAEVLAFDWDSA